MEKFSDNFIANYMINCATYNAESEVAVCGDKRLKWGRLNERANRLAQGLLDMGVKKNDKVVMMFHNRPEFFEVNSAIQKCGAIPVPMNYRFTPPEIEYQTNHCDAEFFIFEDMWLPPVLKAKPALKKVRQYICAGADCPQDMTSYENIMTNFPPKEPNVPTSEDDVCVIVYTGGTTGFPKGVMLTYGAHLRMFEEFMVSILLRISQTTFTETQRRKIKQSSNAPGTAVIMTLMNTPLFRWIMSRPRTARFLHKTVRGRLRDLSKLRKGYKNNNRGMYPSFPLFHDASYQIAMLSPIVGNATFIMTEGVKLDPANVLATIEREKPSLMANVPAGWKMIVEYPEFDKYDVSSITTCASGAGLCAVDLKKKILAKFPGTIFVDMFGQTEMTPIVSFRISTSPDSIKDRDVGKPIVATRIVDEKENDVSPGQIGEIIYKSNTMMKGYYKDEAKTAEVMKDGWFHSGDLGYFDDTGDIRVVERKNECINSGGEKVFPLEVEQVIAQHPGVKYVCVIGVPDEKWGSSIRAIVQPKEGMKPTLEDILAVCEGKLAGFKKPRSLVLVEDFPLSPVGKVLRNKVRESYGKSSKTGD